MRPMCLTGMGGRLLMAPRAGIRSPSAGTWLVRLDDTLPIPDGRSWGDAAIAVHHYGSDNLEGGWWDCKACGSAWQRRQCEHVLAVQAEAGEACTCGHVPSNHLRWPDGRQTTCWDIECPCLNFAQEDSSE